MCWQPPPAMYFTPSHSPSPHPYSLQLQLQSTHLYQQPPFLVDALVATSPPVCPCKQQQPAMLPSPYAVVAPVILPTTTMFKQSNTQPTSQPIGTQFSTKAHRQPAFMEACGHAPCPASAEGHCAQPACSIAAPASSIYAVSCCYQRIEAPILQPKILTACGSTHLCLQRPVAIPTAVNQASTMAQLHFDPPTHLHWQPPARAYAPGALPPSAPSARAPPWQQRPALPPPSHAAAAPVPPGQR